MALSMSAKTRALNVKRRSGAPVSIGRHATLPSRSVITRARLEWPDPQLIESVKAEFPDKGVATIEECRALYSNLGYTYLDVRPKLEIDEVGMFKGAVHIPLKISKKMYDRETNTKSIHKEDNPDFINQVKKKFPKPDTPLMIGCSDGKAYSIDALEALDAAGYTCLVGMRGGYYAWIKVFDNNLRRRRGDGYTEDWSKEEGDSCGIHSTGAGFEKVDPVDYWIPPKF
ncbi:hypothetical protein CEUSTIGMA_g8902.t1 [Chlamydomonas eustigma]|uniref:Rhodanese domain-containing protein n=1 Tax=Chlamydomonas eustigma TaxID=1157962 RepID=A0A250XEI0_9CHLO|nr:hypothetical protein CEUSTIGMA_g8902.t1 [Chlamydomonas eustigma]|eukprot:GAX81473.1 hypothetical protein CEUSTIGMA_g8902.t1 [Chlamydomonas eustigma]